LANCKLIFDEKPIPKIKTYDTQKIIDKWEKLGPFNIESLISERRIEKLNDNSISILKD